MSLLRKGDVPDVNNPLDYFMHVSTFGKILGNIFASYYE